MNDINEVRMTSLGRCFQMCPIKECRLREKHRRLHKFEICEEVFSQTSRPKADCNKCVKEFTRAAAGLATAQLQDIRPPSVLLTTVEYLFQEVLSRNDESWSTLYDFVFDRLRAIRQDLVVQSVWLPDCVTIYEDIIRFHIYSIYRLCEEPISVFDPHINGTHLQECLKRLLVWYYSQDVFSAVRAEMEAYYLLFNLTSADAARHCLNLPPAVRGDSTLQLALDIHLSCLNKNYVRFFNGINKLPFLCCVAVMTHIGSLRRITLYALNIGYSAKNCRFPTSVLKSMLLFDSNDEAEESCRYYGIKVDQSFACFSKTSFDTEKPTLPSRRFGFMKDKHRNISYPRFLFKVS